MSVDRIFTVGHSTRSFEQFLALLRGHGITQLADIRTVPRSRRHPQFSREPLDAELAKHGVRYRHFPGLGGLRKPRPDSENTAWRHPGFRGYADYMQTEEFDRAVRDLLAFAEGAPTAVMCAEALWWQCHRKLLADELTIRGIEVLHIASPEAAARHQVTEFGRERGGKVVYPGLT
jgi:uncharacterized protein (DUF488 family)